MIKKKIRELWWRIKSAVHVLLGRPIIFGVRFPDGYVFNTDDFIKYKQNKTLLIVHNTFVSVANLPPKMEDTDGRDS